MYIMTKEINSETETVKTICITSPRFDIDDVRRVKALIRFKLKNVVVEQQQEGMEVHNINTMMKFGRCTAIGTVNNALYKMFIRVPGKVNDSIYVLIPIYKEGEIYLTIKNAYTTDKTSTDAY